MSAIPTYDEAWDQLYKLSHLEMAKLVRFAPVGHPYFSNSTELGYAFGVRWRQLGGMTPEVSKAIGWERHE